MDDLGTLDACKASDLKGNNGNALPPAGQRTEPSYAKTENEHSCFARYGRRSHASPRSLGKASPHVRAARCATAAFPPRVWDHPNRAVVPGHAWPAASAHVLPRSSLSHGIMFARLPICQDNVFSLMQCTDKIATGLHLGFSTLVRVS